MRPTGEETATKRGCLWATVDLPQLMCVEDNFAEMNEMRHYLWFHW